MVSKRWKTSSTPVLGDDSFMYKLLKDFRGFCENEDTRLVNSWRETFCPPVDVEVETKTPENSDEQVIEQPQSERSSSPTLRKLD
jgi:hypothetical protein